jgi:hypothetical protein
VGVDECLLTVGSRMSSFGEIRRRKSDHSTDSQHLLFRSVDSRIQDGDSINAVFLSQLLRCGYEHLCPHFYEWQNNLSFRWMFLLPNLISGLAAGWMAQ